MVLSKFINPFVFSFGKEKWKSRNTQVRKKAVQELPISDQQTIADIALNDSDESIRIIATNKSSDLNLLQTIIMKGTNQSVKKSAATRFYQLLSGIKHPIPDYKDRQKIIQGSRNPALLEYIAENANEPEFRQIAIKRINRDALLGNIALKDSNADVRLTAAQQVAKRSTLERVVKQSRRKDKRVYKTVKTKLEHIIEDEERPLILAKEVEDICYHLERLYKRSHLLQEKPTYENYLIRWESIENFASKETQQRFVLACKKISLGIEDLEQEKARQQEAIQTLESMLSQLSDIIDEILQARDSHDNESVSDKKNSLNSLSQGWDEEVSKVSSPQAKIFNSRFQALLDLIETSPSENDNQSITNSMMVLCSQIESMLNNSEDFLPMHSIDALDSKFHSQVKLVQHHTPEIEKCINTFEQSLTILQERLKIQNHKAGELKNQIQSTLEQIQSQIDEGQISRAEKNRNTLFRQVEHSHLLASAEKQQYQKSLNQFRSELGKFSSWRNWAHENEREHLTQQAEQLLIKTQENKDLEHGYHEVVAQVKTLRQDWKRLKSSGSDELWERFNHACSQNYELCTPYLNKEAEVRDSHLQAKQALCEQLEQYIETMHWPTDPATEIDQSIDWFKVDQIIRQARKEWNTIGFVDRKVLKVISKRFDKSINIIRGELKQVWNDNHDKFYHLINEVKALHDLIDTDLDQAIEKAKKIQKEWKKIGPVPSYQRNKLWKKFRKNCDLIFDKRQDIIEQRNHDNEIILREKEAICENFEALNQQPLSITDLQNAYNDIVRLWNENKPKLSSLSKDLNQRYAAAKTEYDSKLTLLYAEQKVQQLELFKRKADLCKQLERLSSSNRADVEQFTEKWSHLPFLPAKMETLINTRFNAAIEHIDTDKEALIQAESEQKQHLCLKYEILTGKKSPQEQQQARRKMQVELLNSSMSGRQGEQDKPEPMEMQVQWHSLSDYEYEGDAEIDERFSRLV
jgi:hypothetical protein